MQIQVIDSHTGGEPTRIIVGGGPDLGTGPMRDRLRRFQQDHDGLRSAVVNEPRGSDVLVGGLLVEPHDRDCAFGILFFNNVGFLGMCGHGTIGLVKTLEHLGRLAAGQHRIDTPVGPVVVELESDGRVSVHNVPSYRYATRVEVEVPGYGTVVGDVAYGGNWFFMVREGPREEILAASHAHLSRVSLLIRAALEREEITGKDGASIDHVELFGPAQEPGNHSRNFVMCPGGAYDRSPCGTGSSAKLACLAADGTLAPGEIWNQESLIGSVFSCSYERVPMGAAIGADSDCAFILPKITGSAFVTAESNLILNPEDPFQWGIPS